MLMRRKMKRLCSFAFAALMTVSHIANADLEMLVQQAENQEQSVKSTFWDVAGSEYEKAANKLHEMGVVNGYTDGSFGADKSVTRGELAAMLTRFLNIDTELSAEASPFNDVKTDAWNFGSICALNSERIMSGYGNGNFGPDDTVTYEQAIKPLVSAIGYDAEADYKGGYPWGYVIVAAKNGITKNVDCSVGSVLSRGELSLLLYNALETNKADGTKIADLLSGNLKYFYVSPSGNDDNPGTERKPWKTFNKAAQAVKPGSKVIFEDGEYIEDEYTAIKTGGTKDAPIIFTARNPHKAKIIYTEDVRLTSKIYIFEGADYITVKDFYITQEATATDSDSAPTADILLQTRADHGVISNNHFEKAYEEAIKLYLNDDVIIENNYITGTGHEGMDLFAASNVIVRNNEIYEAGRVGIMVKGNSNNCRVYNNYIHNSDVRMSTSGITVGGSSDSTSPFDVGVGTGFECYNSIFYNNVVVSEKPGAIWTAISFWGATDCRVLNNIVVGAGVGIRYIKMNSLAKGWPWNPPTRNPVVQNNIIYECETAVGADEAPQNPLSSHNLYYKCGGVPKEEGSKVADPQFADKYSDWHVQASSPARNAGAQLPAEFSAYGGGTYTFEYVDADGKARTGEWDIGIYNID